MQWTKDKTSSESWGRYNGLIDPTDIVVTQVRQQSAAGWFVGALQIYNEDECECYSRDSEYYPTEALCIQEYPKSISKVEVFRTPLVRRKLARRG